MAAGTMAAVLFALPALFMDQTPKRRATVDMIAQKAQELLEKLQAFEVTLKQVQENLPVDVSVIEGKMLMQEIGDYGNEPYKREQMPPISEREE